MRYVTEVIGLHILAMGVETNGEIIILIRYALLHKILNMLLQAGTNIYVISSGIKNGGRFTLATAGDVGSYLPHT